MKSLNQPDFYTISAIELSAATLPDPAHILLNTFIDTDALNATQLRSLGAGLTLVWGVTDSALGQTFVAGVLHGLNTKNTLTHLVQLEFATAEHNTEDSLRRLQKNWPAASFLHDDAAIRPITKQLLTGTASDAITLPVYMRGTAFQLQVWRTLLQIPRGKVVSYGAIAKALHKPRAHRAVGTAVGSNPISLFIACHRVIQASGGLGGYAWGLERKIAILAWERLQSQAVA
jgi:AraC family transcriptional regulator, regulatory protein of adaptative response / methylated-DNA-[protein]-cysteine methyltransferase